MFREKHSCRCLFFITKMSFKKQANIHLNGLMKKWQELQEMPNIFSYQLKVSESKYLPGKYKFYSELNPERTTLRRPPQTILSLDPLFDQEKFNFNKIKPEELIMKLKSGDATEISLLINKSPLTRYHTLICPDVDKGLSQRINFEGLKFCVDFSLSLEGNQDFRIGYNSPGALASVNHLHLHLMYIEKDLYVDHANLDFLCDPDIYRIDKSMPTAAICFLFNNLDSEPLKQLKLEKLNKFLQWLCETNMPHNIFMTPERKDAISTGKLKVFVYARQKYCIVRDINTYNIGFCELSGYVPVGTKEIYDDLTEEDVIRKINLETGNTFNKIYKYFKGIS